jgi:hypothetical protein
MDLFSIDLTVEEIVFIRQALDLPTISGKNAKFLANLQTKLEQEYLEIERMKQEAEQQKQADLEAAINADKKKK